MPESFFEMLEKALTYRPKARSTAGQLLKGEFAQFHLHQDETKTVPSEDDEEKKEDAVAESADNLSPRRSIGKTTSVLLKEAVGRHSTFLGYQSFERHLTALLATMLPKDQCKQFLDILRSSSTEFKPTDANLDDKEASAVVNLSKLQVVSVKDLVKVIHDMNTKEAAEV